MQTKQENELQIKNDIGTAGYARTVGEDGKSYRTGISALVSGAIGDDIEQLENDVEALQTAVGTNTEDITDLKEDLSDVKDNLMVESSQYITAWEQGWIRPDGSTGTSAVDCRTGFLQFDTSNLTFTVLSGWKLNNIYDYDATKTPVAEVANSKSGTFELTVDPTHFYRITLETSSESAFTPSNIPSNVLLITSESYTDKTLTQLNKPADAKIVGDAITSIDNILSEVTTTILSSNLFDRDTITNDSSLATDGSITAQSGMFVTDYIPVSNYEGDTLYFSYGGNGDTPIISASGRNVLPAQDFMFYDANKAKVSGTRGAWVRTVTVPSNVVYLRLTFPYNNGYTNFGAVNVGAILDYEEWYKRIVPSNESEVLQNKNDIADLKNPPYYGYLTPYIKLPIMSGIRTDVYYQGVHYGNAKKCIGFYSGNATMHEHSISYTPTDNSDVSTLYLTSYRNNANPEYETISVNVAVIASALGSGKSPKIMLIGDSHTAMGKYQYNANQFLISRGVTPVWLGSLESSYGLSHEGRSGWRAYTYTQCANGSSDGLSGTNAFYHNGEFDFSAYMTAQGYSGVDVVFLALGTNDFARGNHDDIDTVIGYYQTMVDSIHDYDSNIKIVIWLATPPCDRNGVNGLAWSRAYKTFNTAIAFRGSSWGANNIYILPTILAVDPIYDFPYTEVKPNPTSDETIIEATDIVHLSDTGYEHLAYPVCGMIQYIAGLM